MVYKKSEIERILQVAIATARAAERKTLLRRQGQRPRNLVLGRKTCH